MITVPSVQSLFHSVAYQKAGKNLAFSVDVTFTHLDQKMAGFVTAPGATIGKPAFTYELRDQNTVLLPLRA